MIFLVATRSRKKVLMRSLIVIFLCVSTGCFFAYAEDTSTGQSSGFTPIAGYSGEVETQPAKAKTSSELAQATLLLYQKQVADAIEQLEILAAKDTGSVRNPGAHHNLACAYALKAQYEKALSEFNIALEIEKTSFKAVIYCNKALVYLMRNMPQESAKAIEEALKINPGLAQHENIMSIKNYNETSGTQPVYILSYTQSSLELPDTVYYAQKEQRLGQEDIYSFELMKVLPLFFYKSRASLVLMGTGYFFEKKYPEAKEAFLSAIAIEDVCGVFDGHENFVAHYYLGSMEELSGNHREAVSHFEEADEINPDNVANLRNLAWAYFLNREYLEARDTCDRVLQLHPEPGEEKRIQELFNTINETINKSETQ